uniref:Uncharacterized protein n=1 Tax=Nelumbo nucifera TaxID=4432 RepID=A0A822ZLH6_NELNU|nr:TPA_asm: hypothetical protein HUJ06_002469 [Nelumbo nucifera]
MKSFQSWDKCPAPNKLFLSSWESVNMHLTIAVLS